MIGYRYVIAEDVGPLVSTHLRRILLQQKEQAGTYIGGPLNVSGFVFSTGTPDLYVGGATKAVFGPVGLTRLGYLHRFSGVVNYMIEVETNQGRIKPGSEIQFSTEVLAQVGPITLAATPKLEYRLKHVRASSGGLFPAKT